MEEYKTYNSVAEPVDWCDKKASEKKTAIPLTDQEIENFKKELFDLIERYNVSVEFTCEDCSDTHGLYGDHIAIRDRASGEYIIHSEGWYLLKDYLQ